jgi:uncharacterized membrane protein YphA (DoxX/SURF4 family)
LLASLAGGAIVFEQAVNDERNVIGDWALRGGIAVAFCVFGMEKFSDGMWVKMFAEIGWGQWFRYFTGVVEVAGGLMMLVPRLARVGGAVLAATMASAALIMAFVLGKPGNSVFSGLFCLGLCTFLLSRRN